MQQQAAVEMSGARDDGRAGDDGRAAVLRAHMRCRLPRELRDYIEHLVVVELELLARRLLQMESRTLCGARRAHGGRGAIGDRSLGGSVRRATALWQAIASLCVSDACLELCRRRHHDVWYQICEQAGEPVVLLSLWPRLERAMRSDGRRRDVNEGKPAFCLMQSDLIR